MGHGGPTEEWRHEDGDGDGEKKDGRIGGDPSRS